MLRRLKRTAVLLSAILIFIPSVSSARVDLMPLVRQLLQLYGVNVDVRDLNRLQTDRLADVSRSLFGTHHYGSFYYSDADYDWGRDAGEWQSILLMSGQGRGEGELGEMISRLARQFPISGGLDSPNQTENQYYRLSAQNALASRSGAEVAYRQAVRAEHTMNSLQQFIDRAADAKSATDLNNRLVSENARISIQQTKLLSILVQQAALAAQERANRAVEDREFFGMG